MTTYLVQKIKTSESTVWATGQLPSVEKTAHYETLYSTESRAEALTICKYEIRRTNEPCRVVTELAWKSQQSGIETSKRGSIITAKSGQVRATERIDKAETKLRRGQARAGLTVTTGPRVKRAAQEKYYQHSTPKQLQTRTKKLWKALKALW